MSKITEKTKVNQQHISEKDIDSLYKKIEEFQKLNKKYLLKPQKPADENPNIITMVNTLS